MTERHTDVAEYGTVGKVTLQAANRKFLCQELQNGIGNAQVYRFIIRSFSLFCSRYLK